MAREVNNVEMRVETVVSATDAKNNLGALLAKVTGGGESIIVERQGKPRAAIISIEEFRQFRVLQEQERRREAIATLRRIRDEVSARNSDLTPEQIEEFASAVRHDAHQTILKRGLVRFVE